MAKILLIDDDVQILKILTEFLESDHHEVTSAEDGKMGLAQLESERFDLIITDVIMPEQDGIAVMLWVLKQVNRPKVIAMSGGSSLLDPYYLLEMCTRLRADKVLQKPVNLETLKNAINEVLELSVNRL